MANLCHRELEISAAIVGGMANRRAGWSRFVLDRDYRGHDVGAVAVGFGNELVDLEGFRLDVGMNHCKPVGLPYFVAIECHGPENVAVESAEAKSGYGAIDRVLSRVVLIEVLC